MALSLLSGLLAALSFPTRFDSLAFSLWPLAWGALVPAYVVWVRHPASYGRAFLEGMAVGFGLYGLSLYWIVIALHVHGKIPISGAVFTLFLLVLILSGCLGLSFILASWLRKRGIPRFLAFSLPWIFQDWVRNSFPFGGFSWSSLAYSQGDFSLLLQITDLVGPYGVTFLILLANALFGEVYFFLKKESHDLPRALPLAFALCLGSSLLYGHWRTGSIERLFEKFPEKEVVVIQGNIPQEEKWIVENVEGLIDQHKRLTDQALQDHRPDLIVWPEASFPVVIPPEIKTLPLFASFGTPLLMGAITYRGEVPEFWPPTAEDDFHLFNSALLVESGGEITARYDKNHLVPMGEYVPLKGLFFFVEKIVPGFADFEAGEGFRLIETGSFRMGATICYEDLFPEISRAFVRNGGNLLVNLTNDAWYEHSSAIDQHAVFSKFRAIENRRYLVRATNTGLTAVFDPLGREVARAPLFQEAILFASVRPGGPVTVYTRFGDWFVGGAFVFILFLLIGRRKWRRGTP